MSGKLGWCLLAALQAGAFRLEDNQLSRASSTAPGASAARHGARKLAFVVTGAAVPPLLKTHSTVKAEGTPGPGPSTPGGLPRQQLFHLNHADFQQLPEWKQAALQSWYRQQGDPSCTLTRAGEAEAAPAAAQKPPAKSRWERVSPQDVPEHKRAEFEAWLREQEESWEPPRKSPADPVASTGQRQKPSAKSRWERISPQDVPEHKRAEFAAWLSEQDGSWSPPRKPPADLAASKGIQAEGHAATIAPSGSQSTGRHWQSDDATLQARLDKWYQEQEAEEREWKVPSSGAAPTEQKAATAAPPAKASATTSKCDSDCPFTFGMMSWEQGDESVVVFATRDSDGKQVAMKRPKYSQNLWDDTMGMECFIHRYLNVMGVPNVPDCVADSYLRKDEVLRAGLAGAAEFDRANDGSGKWHAIFIEMAGGSSVDLNDGRLSSRIPPGYQDIAVWRIMQTTFRMLCAGVVNGDQWHNILLEGNGEVNFIDFGVAGFLDERPLLKAEEAGFKIDQSSRKYRGPAEGYSIDVRRPQVLSDDAAEQQVRRMLELIFKTIGQPGAVYNAMSRRPKLGEGDCGGDSPRMRQLGPRLNDAIAQEYEAFQRR